MDCDDRDAEDVFEIDPATFTLHLSQGLRDSLGLDYPVVTEDEFRAVAADLDGLKFYRAVRDRLAASSVGSSFVDLTLKNGKRLFATLFGSEKGIRGSMHFAAENGSRINLASLVALGDLIESPEGLASLLQIVADEVQDSLDADRVVLITIDKGGIEHFIKAGPGVSQIVEVEYAELWDGLSGWVMRERSTAFSPRGTDDLRESLAVRERRRNTACGDIIVAPLIHHEVMLGTVTAINLPKDPPFRSEDVALVEVLAKTAAAAVFAAHSLFGKHARFDELYRLATHDELTGLYNRRMFADISKRAIAASRRVGRTLSMLFLDLDGFKQVNDTYGHYIGDCLLKEVAARIVSSVRCSETAARLGGDEFIILFESVSHISDVENAARRLIESISAPYSIDGKEVRVGASAGISSFPADGGEYAQLVDHADHALYQAKREGKGTFRIFSGDRRD